MLHIEVAIFNVKKYLERMGEVVITMIGEVESSIRTGDLSRLESIAREDRHLDNLEKELDKKAIELLALINPLASDFRFIFSVIKLNVDLERIGDECKNVAREMVDMDGPVPEELKTMAAKVQLMVHQTIEALNSYDAHLAREVVKLDAEIDALQLLILNQYSKRVPLAFMSKALERIADHCTNVAESVAYAVEGSDIADLRNRYKISGQMSRDSDSSSD